MEIKNENIYYALNATGDLIGAKGYFADDIDDFERGIFGIYTLEAIDNYHFISKERVDTSTDVESYKNDWNFFYLVEPAPKIMYVTENAGKLIIIDRERAIKWYLSLTDSRIIFSGTEKECEQWIANQPPKYRPFESSEELISVYKEKLLGEVSKSETSKLYQPTVWIKSKVSDDIKYNIVYYSTKAVMIALYANSNCELNLVYLPKLLERYTFLDGSPCGVEIPR